MYYYNSGHWSYLSKWIKKYGTSRTLGTGHVTRVYVVINSLCFQRGNSFHTGSVNFFFDDNEWRCRILSVSTLKPRQNFPLQGQVMRVQYGARQLSEIMHFFSLSCMESTAFVSYFLWNEFMTRCRNQLFHVYDNVNERLGEIVVSVGFFFLFICTFIVFST